MADAKDEVLRRVLQMKMRALGDPARVLMLVRGAAPFYRALGGTNVRFLQNVDDPRAVLHRNRIRSQCGHQK